jgi:tetratricopeptide (TPR) repeat protein
LSIHWLQLAIDGCGNNSPHLPFWYQDLAMVYFTCYKHRKNRDDLEQAIKFESSALEMISPDHPDFVKCSHDLAQLYLYRFERLREEEDVSKGIEVLVRVVGASPSDCPGLLEAQKTLARLYMNRVRIKGSKEDVDTAIHLRKLVIEATSPGTAEHIVCIQDLGAAYLEKYTLFDSFEDLELSIKHLQEAITEVPIEEPIYAALFQDLGIALMMKYYTKGGDENIKLAVQYTELSVKSLPAGDKRIPHAQKHLAQAYYGRYSLSRDIGDLKQAQDLLKQALRAIRPTDPQLHELHDTLATVYQCFFIEFGDLSYISLALDHYKLAMDGISPTSIHLCQYEQNIAHCYGFRFNSLLDHHDLELGIQYSIQSLQHGSASHLVSSSAKHILSGLLSSKFAQYNDIADLDFAIQLEVEALNGLEETNPERPMWLYDLVRLHLSYHSHTKDITHLEAALLLMKEKSLKMAHENYQLSSDYLCTRAIMEEKLWRVDGNFDRIYACIEQCNLIINCIRTDDPILPILYQFIGTSFSRMYTHSQVANSGSVSQEFSVVEDAYCALYYFRASVTSPLVTPTDCLFSAVLWARFAESLNLNETLTAYHFALGTLPNVLWIGNSLGDRYHSVVKLKISDLVSSAVAAALKFNDVKCAVEFMEQGLAITYRQMLELRDEPTQLIEQHHKIGLEFKQISLKLQEISHPERTIKQDYHSLVIRQKDLIQQIRTLPGFEDFFLPKLFKELSKAANYGPVVVLNCTSEGSAAIILLPSTHGSSGNPLSVPLPDATIADLQHHCEMLRKALGFVSAREVDKPEKERSKKSSHKRSAELSLKYFTELLDWLWKAIVKPVYDVLESVSNNFCNIQPLAKLLIEWY